jgi:hypothetical protein
MNRWASAEVQHDRRLTGRQKNLTSRTRNAGQIESHLPVVPGNASNLPAAGREDLSCSTANVRHRAGIILHLQDECPAQMRRCGQRTLAGFADVIPVKPQLAEAAERRGLSQCPRPVIADLIAT